MTVHTVTYRLALGGTDFGERLVAELVKHPEIIEVLETAVVGGSAQDNYAANVRIVYRADRYLSWNELRRAVAVDVPIYDLSGIDIEAVRAAQREGLD